MYRVFTDIEEYLGAEPVNMKERKRNKMNKLVARYGKRTANIVTDLIKGLSTKKIAAKRHLKLTTVATTAGNFSRGSYDRFIG